MKKNITLITNLLLSSTLFWGVPMASGQETIVKVPADTTSYCHMKFPRSARTRSSRLTRCWMKAPAPASISMARAITTR
jgi:hypothetical protein